MKIPKLLFVQIEKVKFQHHRRDDESLHYWTIDGDESHQRRYHVLVDFLLHLGIFDEGVDDDYDYVAFSVVVVVLLKQLQQIVVVEEQQQDSSSTF